MTYLRQAASRLKALFRRKRIERDMAAELQAHLEMQEAANRAAGMSSQEAHYAAHRQFGHLDGVKEFERIILRFSRCHRLNGADHLIQR